MLTSSIFHPSPTNLNQQWYYVFAKERGGGEGIQAEREMKPTTGVILSSACDEFAMHK